MKRISVSEPLLDGNERSYVLDCLDSNWISSAGKYISQFESAFAKYCGTRHAIATSNGTTGLHLALVALGLGPSDEVIVPTVTYIASANAVTYCGAKPVFVDVLHGSLNIDPAQVRRKISLNTKGILAVHLYGHPAAMNELQVLAKEHGLWIVEDAAEAHGAELRGRKVGGLGDCGVFSFFGNKIITTGEGGMITTNDDKLADQLRLYRGQGMDPARRYWFPVIGYNYRMTNIQAALGLAQLEQIEKRIDQREQLREWYDSALAPLENKLLRPVALADCKQVNWMYNVFLRHGGRVERDEVIAKLAEAQIETRPVFHPMHVLPPYHSDELFPVADVWAGRGLSLPTHPSLSRRDVDRIAKTLSKCLVAR